MERKLTKVVDGTEITVGGKMCSCGTDVANDLCSWESTDTCGDVRTFGQKRYIKDGKCLVSELFRKLRLLD